MQIGNIASGTSLLGSADGGNVFYDLDGFPGYRIDVLAGATVIGSDSNRIGVTIPEGVFQQARFYFDTGPAPAQLGQPLGILMLNVEASERSAAAAERSALEASLAAHLEAVNALLDPHERLDCLVVVTQPWTVESGLITPTFKVRRNRIEDVYASHYERWVVERRAVIWHEG